MERVTWKLTLPYVKWIANGNFLYGSGNSNKGSVSTYSKNDAHHCLCVAPLLEVSCSWGSTQSPAPLSSDSGFPEAPASQRLQKILSQCGFKMII